MKITTILAGAMVSLLAGCDAVNEFVAPSGGKDKAAQEEARKKRESEEQAAKLSADRDALKRRIEASCKAMLAEVEELKRTETAARADGELLATRIRELTARGADGKLKPRYALLSDLLEDEKVNELARKYLRRDFQLTRFQFVEQVTQALDQERRKAGAHEKNLADYNAAVKYAEETAKSSREAVNQAATEVRREIADLERKRHQLKHRLEMTSVTDRTRMQRELNDIDNRVRALQSRYDGINANRQVSHGIQNSDRARMDATDAAARRHRQTDDIIRKGYAGKQASSAVITIFENDTIRALEVAINSTADGASGQSRKLTRSIDYLKELARGIDSAGVMSLERIRKDLDARFAAESRDE